jgi:hypothetical protein
MSSERSVKDLFGPYIKFLEARVGFEPTNDGFADHSLRPLGYRAPVAMPEIYAQLYAQRAQSSPIYTQSPFRIPLIPHSGWV